MAYVAARGGEKAIQQAEKLYHASKGKVTRSLVENIQETMPYLVDRVMGESSLYAPQLAALALAQSGGDLYESVLLMRAFRSTQPRLAYAETVTDQEMMIVRRISAAFKNIPGGQILGPSLDYSHRLLQTHVLDDKPSPDDEPLQPADKAAQRTYPFVADWERHQGLVEALSEIEPVEPGQIPDLTREPLMIPASRSHRLQALARAETGGVLTLGYANMRGYGGVHPTVNELRLAYADVNIKHPLTGASFIIGRIRMSQAEVVSTMTSKAASGKAGSEKNKDAEAVNRKEDEPKTASANGQSAGANGTSIDSTAASASINGASANRTNGTATPNGTPPSAQSEPTLELGFTATMGWNEVKCIAGSMLDLAMSKPTPHPAHEEEFVLYHTEPIESSGFCIHYKLPHYVTFNSTLDNYREVMAASGWLREPNGKAKPAEQKSV